MSDSEYSENEQNGMAEIVASGMSGSAYGYSVESYCYTDCAAQTTVECENLMFSDATNYGCVEFTLDNASDAVQKNINKLDTAICRKTTATRYLLREGIRSKNYTDEMLGEVCDKVKDEKFCKIKGGRKSAKTRNNKFNTDEYSKLASSFAEEKCAAELMVTKKIDAEAEAVGFANFNAFLKHNNNATVFKCQHFGCDRVFNRQPNLVLHQNVHNEKYRCSVGQCDYCAPSAVDLKRHQRKHTGEKPFRCSVGGCSEAFTQKSNLRKHVTAVHLSLKEFVCAECGKGFAQKVHLTAHQRIHTGLKPFECPHCLQRFKEKGKLNRHLRSKHMQEV